jgi:methylated-DNA-[protein]-cysteine S-methyltransferase
MEQVNTQTVFWTHFVYDKWSIYMAATSKGLCYVGSQNKSLDELVKWKETYLPNHDLQQNDAKMTDYMTQFREYFQGQRTEFTLPIDLYGTHFQMSVWHALIAIPHGVTYSYSDIAAHINNPNAVRAVGASIGANPILIAVPCHRVIGKNGALTGYRGGLEMKTELLKLERDRLIVC